MLRGMDECRLDDITPDYYAMSTFVQKATDNESLTPSVCMAKMTLWLGEEQMQDHPNYVPHHQDRRGWYRRRRDDVREDEVDLVRGHGETEY